MGPTPDLNLSASRRVSGSSSPETDASDVGVSNTFSAPQAIRARPAQTPRWTEVQCSTGSLKREQNNLLRPFPFEVCACTREASAFTENLWAACVGSSHAARAAAAVQALGRSAAVHATTYGYVERSVMLAQLGL